MKISEHTCVSILSLVIKLLRNFVLCVASSYKLAKKGQEICNSEGPDDKKDNEDTL